ncbi:hypothetical protein [Avibacterium sp. 21-599]|uniref:hypothetical protein n=1 Tax=Avibacterium sp. 21-599 TaxID=2911528 RepID=UPI0022484C27|nr:hypothetical protein [Avibacterium sp. 21-599]MCW9718828.1 hypothetical protein [Avibacterium sp. 21-599]
MSNKGKKGEMIVSEIVSKMGRVDGSSVDFKRPSITNTADNGIDLWLTHNEDHLREMVEISQGCRSDFSDPKSYEGKKIDTRIDVKSYSGKINKPVAEKFVSDIAKSPLIEGHLLIGGQGLTKGAKDVLENATDNYPKKKIGYISSEGVERIKKAVDRQLNHQDDKKIGY